MNIWKLYTDYAETLSQGCIYPLPSHNNPYTAKPGSHDDGPVTNLFLGGIGAPAVSRSLDGDFSRWHLQTGYHVHQAIDSAFIGLRWQTGKTEQPEKTVPAPAAEKRRPADLSGGYLRLHDSGAASYGMSRTVYSLFPVIHEHYCGEKVPVEIRAEFFSSIVPGDESISCLPVWFADIAVKNRSSRPLDIDAGLFLPNMLGWKVQQMTAAARPAESWPGQTHAGNTAASFSENGNMHVSGVLQQRFTDYPHSHHQTRNSCRDDMEGETALLSFRHEGASADRKNASGNTPLQNEIGGGKQWRSSTEACFKAGQNLIDRPPEQQKHTIAWAEQYFAKYGALPQTEMTWRAHWDEALASAAAQGVLLEPGESAVLHYCIAYDIPVTAFGSGRKWYRKYTEQFGVSGKQAAHIASYAAAERYAARSRIAEWQDSVLRDNSHLSSKLKAAMINELYFVNGGGTAWVSGMQDQKNQQDQKVQKDPEGSGFTEPLLGAGSHAAILEGFDIGYYYYNTSDIWPYAWYALSRWWPGFADSIFGDFAKTVPLEIPEKHLIYRTETMAPILVKGKIPHDAGSAMEDPWHRINGYQMRDDSNLWKDHNPGFIISLFLHKRLTENSRTDRISGKAPTKHQLTKHQLKKQQQERKAVYEAGNFMLGQLNEQTGLPYHDAFGDSTWDNLGILGTAAFSGSLTLAALAALCRWRPEGASQDSTDADADHLLTEKCREMLEKGMQSFVSSLWNGSYYRMSDSGKYADCIMADGILGFYFADLAGLLDMMPAVSRESLKSHLQSVYRYNFKKYEDGRFGPLLVASEQETHFSGDGGDELQVNEVLTGSAWMTAAMMHHFGLSTEGNEVAEAVRKTLYERSGLQFRTPAAYDAYGRFRAPMNLRPLSIWFLDEKNFHLS